MGLSNDLSCEAGSFSCCRLNPHGHFQSEVWGFISPHWSPGLLGLLCSPPLVPVYLCVSVGLRGTTRHSACPVLRHSESGPLGLSVRECGATGSASGQTACPFHRQSLSRHGHASPLCPGVHLRPSYRSGCTFLFYLLGVGLPCRWIFCQFWLCEEAQCVYLHHHLGSPLINKVLKKKKLLEENKEICDLRLGNRFLSMKSNNVKWRKIPEWCLQLVTFQIKLKNIQNKIKKKKNKKKIGVSEIYIRWS